MTTIREPERSSTASLESRNDELELIIAASRLGYCVLGNETRGLRANSQFKAEFGWAPDASIDWSELEERVAAEGRSALAESARLALASGTNFDLVVQSVWPDFSVFKDARFAFASIGIFFMEWGLFIPLTYIVSYAAAHGQDATESYLLLSYLNAGSVLGRVLPGFLADRFGRFNVIIVTIALCVVTVLALWLPAGTSDAVLIVYAVLFGFASGSNLGLVPVCLGQLCDHRRYGRLYSTAMMVASFGTLSSVPIGGAILDSGSSEDAWRNLVIFAGVAYFIALGCYTTSRVLAVGWSPRKIF